jgi:hypothetical protein
VEFRVPEFQVVELALELVQSRSMDRRLAPDHPRRWAEGVQTISVRALSQVRSRARSGEAGWRLRTVWEPIPIQFAVAERTAAAVRYEGAVGRQHSSSNLCLVFGDFCLVLWLLQSWCWRARGCRSPEAGCWQLVWQRVFQQVPRELPGYGI